MATEINKVPVSGNKIFTTEHGPKGGDELNLIIPGNIMVGPISLTVLQIW